MRSFIAVAVAVIQDSQGRYLLTQRSSPKWPEVHLKWQLAGGKIEFGESPEKTLMRECREELGHVIDIQFPCPIVKTHVWHHTGEQPEHTLLIAYLCKLRTEEKKIVLNSESHAYDWFTFSQLKKLDLLPQTFDIIKEFREIQK